MSHARILDGIRPWPTAPRRPRRRSRLIGTLRILLPAVALVVIGLVVAWPQIMRGTAGLTVPIFAPDDADQSDLLRMDSPRYRGQTESNAPYEVTARSASFDPLAANIVHLDRPAADIARGKHGDIHLVAQNGVYDRDADRLMLDGGIEVVTSTGYRFATPSARINLERGQVHGAQPIEGEGPPGTLSADRFEIREAGDVLRFEGRVKVTVLPAAGRAGSPDASASEDEGGTSS